jgi:hypothetical protein
VLEAVKEMRVGKTWVDEYYTSVCNRCKDVKMTVGVLTFTYKI